MSAMIRGAFSKKVVATKIVAADGSGDFTNIQDAIDDLPAEGGVVYIREGTYPITSTITISTDSVSLFGAGKATKIQTTEQIAMIQISGTRSNVRIKDLYLYGSGSDVGANLHGIWFYICSDCSVTNCWIENVGHSGIAVTNTATKLIINNNFIYSNIGNGIQLLGITDCIISNNVIRSNKTRGILLLDSDDNVIVGNLCLDNDVDDTGTYDGIFLWMSNNNLVEGNRCRDNDRYEINVFDSSSNNNLILGNICLGTDHVGAINDAGTNTVMGFNIITTEDTDLKGKFRLPQGGSWVLKDYRGFTIFEVKEDGSVYIKGRQVKI